MTNSITSLWSDLADSFLPTVAFAKEEKEEKEEKEARKEEIEEVRYS